MRHLTLLLTIALLATTSTADPDPRYWRLDQVNQQLTAWAAAYPDLVHLTSLGTSGEGEAIPLVCISDNAAVREAEPGVFQHAAQHANECNGTGAVMQALARLLENYGIDPQLTARVDELELWFAPIVNVDGHRYVFAASPSWADWRKTLRDNNDNGEVDFPADGVDMNRNWDWRWDEYAESDPRSQKYKGPYPFSEPEVRALRDFILRERPLVTVDYHSPVTISWTSYIFYVWPQSPDHTKSREIAEEWAAATRDRNNDTYDEIYAFDTLPKQQCWVHGNTGLLVFLMEIEDQCWFTGATVDTIAHRVARGSMTLLDRVRAGPGIQVQVTSALTGEPLAAEIEILELDGGNIGARHCDQETGRYERFTDNGTYTVRASFRDHETITETVLVSGGWAHADIALPPVATAIDGPQALTDLAVTLPSPLRAGQPFQLRIPAGIPAVRAELFDVRGRRVTTLARDLAADSAHQLVLPRSLSDGVYLLRLTAGPTSWSRRVVYMH